MTKLIGIAILMMASVGWGQTICSKTPNDNCTVLSGNVTTAIVTTVAAPLKCWKYQHVEWRSCPPEQQICTLSGIPACYCNVQQPSYCADDLHTVTEREWQELMERLKEMERLLLPYCSDLSKKALKENGICRIEDGSK